MVMTMGAWIAVGTFVLRHPVLGMGLALVSVGLFVVAMVAARKPATR